MAEQQLMTDQQQLHDVWPILLEAPQTLDQLVICKLLCCSSVMSKLVHAMCGGKLHVQVKPADKGQSSHSPSSSGSDEADSSESEQSEGSQGLSISSSSSSDEASSSDSDQPEGSHGPTSSNSSDEAAAYDSEHSEGSHGLSSSFSDWLRSNARLLHSLTVLGPTRSKPVTPSEADITSGLTAAAAATAAVDVINGPQCSSSSGSLPLQTLACYSSCKGSIFSSLAVARQLTGLTLSLDLSDPPAGCADALAALTCLQNLTLGVSLLRGVAALSPPSTEAYMTGNFGVIGTALQRLNQLTRMDVDPYPDTMDECSGCFGPFSDTFVPCLEAAGCVQALPPSLKVLHMSGELTGRWRLLDELTPRDVLNLEHLTSLSVLRLRCIKANRVLLPAGLRVLRLPDCVDIAGFVPDKLQQLEELYIPMHQVHYTGMAHMSSVLKGLRGCPQFRELHLGIKTETTGEPLRLLQVLADLPVVELGLSAADMSVQVVSSLGAPTQLTSLSVAFLSDEAPVVKQLAAILQQLTALQRLSISGTSVEAADFVDWQLVCQAVVAMRGLKSVLTDMCTLGDAAAHLAAATQLTHVGLQRSYVSDASKAALAEGLQHLLPEHLQIEQPSWAFVVVDR